MRSSLPGPLGKSEINLHFVYGSFSEHSQLALKFIGNLACPFSACLGIQMRSLFRFCVQLQNGQVNSLRQRSDRSYGPTWTCFCITYVSNLLSNLVSNLPCLTYRTLNRFTENRPCLQNTENIHSEPTAFTKQQTRSDTMDWVYGKGAVFRFSRLCLPISKHTYR